MAIDPAAEGSREPDDTPPSLDDESGRAKPPQPLQTASEANRGIKDPQPDFGGQQGPPPGQTAQIDASTLGRFLTFYPLLRLFNALANSLYASTKTPEERFATMRTDHKKFYGFCVFVDAILVIIASVALLAAGVTVLYKTVWL